MDNYNNPVTEVYGPKEAGMATKSSGTPTPIFAAKSNVRVDIELKVLLKWVINIYYNDLYSVLWNLSNFL